MDEDFSKVPVSLAERRAEKSDKGSLWSPRDVLIAMLRDVDAGKIKPESIIVCYREKLPDGSTSTGAFQSTPDLHTSLGMMEVVKFRFLNR